MSHEINKSELAEFVREKYGPATSHMYINKVFWGVCEDCGSVLDPELDDACVNNPDCTNYFFAKEYALELKKRSLN